MLVGHRQLRRRGRRGRAQVGHKIADGEIGFVPHGGDHRNAGGRHRPRDRLVVEGPQLLNGTAAAADDEHIRRIRLVEAAQGGDQLRRPPLALHEHRGEHHPREREPPAEHVENIPHRRAGRRGDDPDPRRIPRQRLFAGGLE